MISTKYVIQFITYAALLFFAVLMLQITLQYIPLDLDVAFLRIKQDVITYRFYQVAFFTHVYTSMFALIAGFTQFSLRFRTKNKEIHRLFGKVYIIVILALSGPSGLIMGIFANGGITSQIAFVLLAILWWWFTFKAFSLVKRGDILHHREFMIRSFALTLSAVTLRLWKLGITNTFDVKPMDAYRLVAWLGWIPNLIIAEMYIRLRTFGQ
jgi:uncharacterized membrane protein